MNKDNKSNPHIRAKKNPRRPKRAPRPSGKKVVVAVPVESVPQNAVDDILSKRDLLVHPELARTVCARYLGKNPELLEKLKHPQALRSAEYEKMKKWVRQELRVLVGMFVIETNPEKLVSSRASVILSAHRSTRERQPHYDGLYSALFDGKNPSHILDLCAGINPCSYEYLGCKPNYSAVDVSPQLMDFVQAWFNENNVEGKAWCADVTRMNEYPDSDTVFLFKATDVLERVEYGYGEKLLEELFKMPGRRVIVSFATATIGGGREIKVSKRFWVERWAGQHGKSIRIRDIPGERFYVIE